MMLGEKHDLKHEFPEYRDRIHELKLEDKHFAHLLEQYTALDDEIRKLELDGQPTSDEYLENLKMKRLKLKDELHQILKS